MELPLERELDFHYFILLGNCLTKDVKMTQILILVGAKPFKWPFLAALVELIKTVTIFLDLCVQKGITN